MRNGTPRQGFSLVELIVVIGIISILMGIIVVAVAAGWRYAQIGAAKTQLSTVATALEAYRLDFGSYPPDDFPTKNGAECLAWHLCQKFKKGESFVGPYLAIPVYDRDKNGFAELYSPLKTPYHYVVTVDSKGQQLGYLSIDCGWDRKLGGNVDPSLGFVPDGTGEDTDNIVQK